MRICLLLPFLFVIAAITPSIGLSAELFTNGDFELGATGFETDYSFSSTDTTLAGQFSVTSSPHLVHPSWGIFDDHTPSGTQMLVANGSTTAGLGIWRDTVSVVPGEDYTFSAWVTSVFAGSPAELSFRVNDVEFDSLELSPAVSVWANVSEVINAGANSSLTFEIVDLNLAGNGNDFALDDLSLDGPLPVPEPAGICLLFVGVAGLLHSHRVQRCR